MTDTKARKYLLIFDCDGVLVDSEPTSNRVLAAASPFSQQNANLQLRHGDRRNCDIVNDHIGQGITPALGIDQHRRIEDQSRQGPSQNSCPREAPGVSP